MKKILPVFFVLFLYTPFIFSQENQNFGEEDVLKQEESFIENSESDFIENSSDCHSYYHKKYCRKKNATTGPTGATGATGAAGAAGATGAFASFTPAAMSLHVVGGPATIDSADVNLLSGTGANLRVDYANGLTLNELQQIVINSPGAYKITYGLTPVDIASTVIESSATGLIFGSEIILPGGSSLQSISFIYYAKTVPDTLTLLSLYGGFTMDNAVSYSAAPYLYWVVEQISAP